MKRPAARNDAPHPGTTDREWRLTSILEATRAGTWEWNVVTGDMTLNERWAEIVGYTLEELEPVSIDTWRRLSHPQDLENANALLEQHFAGELPYYQCDLRMRHKNGEWVWVVDRGKVVAHTADGGPLLMFGTHIDVSERKAAEEEIKRAEGALKHSSELLRYVIEHARSAVAVHDRDLNYIYVSRRYLQEYGVTHEDVLGRNHYDVFPDIPEKWRVVHQKALKGEVLSAEDDPYPHADGTVDWTRWECRPWYEADGTIGGIIVYTEMINERKQAEASLLQYQQRLRALAAELVTSGEREQRRLATELHDSVGQLLVVAKMEAQFLADESSPDQAFRSAHLVDLLNEAIQEVRALTAHLAPSVLIGRGLGAALRWLAERYSELFGLVTTVRVDSAAEAHDIEMKMFVFRIVRESLNNVARHSGVSHAMVTVRRTSGRLTVSVTDRGAGLEPSTPWDGASGRGFGLFSINEECLARGGSLKVWSSPGRGTRVTATIPDNLSSVDLG